MNSSPDVWRSALESLTRLVDNDQAPALQFLLGHDGKVLATNSALRSFAGSANISDWQEFAAAADLPMLRTQVSDATTDCRAFDTIARLVRFDGSIRQFLLRAEPRFADDGQFVGLIVSGMDATAFAGPTKNSAMVPHLNPLPVPANGDMADTWHSELVSSVTIVKACVDMLPDLMQETIHPDLAAVIVKLEAAALSQQQTLHRLSRISRRGQKSDSH